MLGTVMVALLYAGSDYEKTCLLTLRAARHINAFDRTLSSDRTKANAENRRILCSQESMEKHDIFME